MNAPAPLAHSSKTKLLDAALNVIRSKGYNATTLDDICAAAGVTKGSFFHHFSGKEDLALSAVKHWNDMTSGLFASKTDTSSVLQMPEVDTRLLALITDDIRDQLVADLQATGFEVLPEAAVVASAQYQKIVQMAGISNFSKFANLHGDVMLVGAGQLKPYLPYSAEAGKFAVPQKNLIKGWVTGMLITSSTAGGPTSTSTGGIYELPALEVALKISPPTVGRMNVATVSLR